VAITNYAALTKPGIIAGNAITMAAGFACAAQGNLWLFLQTLLAFSCVIASACVFNNYIDRHADKKMARTSARALSLEIVTEQKALKFALLLGLCGFAYLALIANGLATGAAACGFLIYVAVYSLLKYKSPYATWIGGVAGAAPPLVGYFAAGGGVDQTAYLLFLLVFFWQIPHFFAIALYRSGDYAAAGIPVLPLKRGAAATRLQMVVHIAAFTAVAYWLTASFIALSLGLIWLVLCLRPMKDAARFGRQLFLFSLAVIIGCSAAIIFHI
jgi:protoheme IX farnesyltransferase